MPSQTGPTPYLLGLLQIQIMDPEPYLFDKECLVLPAHLKLCLPSEIVQGFIHARWAASKALRFIKIVEKNYNKRYYAMCPLTTPDRVLAHVESVSRLVTWKSDYNHTNPTLAPTAKIDPNTLSFRIDHRAYDQFARNYIKLLEQFIDGPHKRWIEAKQELDARVKNANLNATDYDDWYRFWGLTFLVEMNKWEGRLEGLVLPSWEEIMDSLCHLILELVESPQDALTDLFVENGLMTQ